MWRSKPEKIYISTKLYLLINNSLNLLPNIMKYKLIKTRTDLSNIKQLLIEIKRT